MHKGTCLCDDVAFEISSDMRSVTACHCTQCRKMSGHSRAATSAPDGANAMTHDTGLKRFRASNTATRDFCGTCASSLFWKPDGRDRAAISAGALDRDTGLSLTKPVIVADKGDYYTIADGLPQAE